MDRRNRKSTRRKGSDHKKEKLPWSWGLIKKAEEEGIRIERRGSNTTIPKKRMKNQRKEEQRTTKKMIAEVKSGAGEGKPGLFKGIKRKWKGEK